MRRVMNVLGLVLLVFIVVVGALTGYLATSNPAPRRPAEAGWVPVKAMPGARGDVAAAVVRRLNGGPRLCPRDPCPELLVYVAGGIGGAFSKTTDRVQRFDPPAASWTDGPKLPEARNHAAAAALGDTLFVTGGSKHTLTREPEANVWILRPGRRSFERLSNMPEPRTGHAMVEVRGKLYVLGGKGPSSRVEIFDPSLGTWKLGSAMPAPRDGVAAVALQDRIYVIGGKETAGPSRRVDIYDPPTDAWSEAAALPAGDSGGAAAVLSDGLIHLIGGEDPSLIGGKVLDIHLVLDPIDNKWIQAPQPILPVHGAGVAVVNGEMLIIGGSRRQGTLSPLGWTGFAQVFAPGLLQPSPQPSPTPSATTKPKATASPKTS